LDEDDDDEESNEELNTGMVGTEDVVSDADAPALSGN
jgi:hypothetical protein